MPATPWADDVPAERWHGETPAAWRERWGLPTLLIFRSVGSTNDVARAIAEAGAPHGSAVLADAQTRGRGRRGGSWHAHPGHGLLVSVVLRPRAAAAAVLPLRIGIAVARAVEAFAPVEVGIKWPNDLLVGDRKLGGILCEGALEGAATAWVVAGVGINVLQRDDQWPVELRGAATSIAAAAGVAVDMPTLAARTISAISMAPDSPVLGPAELAELELRDALRGRAVTVDGRPAGEAAGIDPAGALVVRDGARTRRITSGTIRVTAKGATHESEL